MYCFFRKNVLLALYCLFRRDVLLVMNCLFRKDVRLPVQLQRAMAAEAEAAREARAKVRKKEGFYV